MSSDKMRAEFEAWANSFFANAPTKYKRDALPKDDPNYGDYVSMPLQAAWQAWQASRAEPVVAPAVQGEPVAITDADILAIAGRVESCPVSPWWLKDDVAIGDVRAAVLRFARALLVAAPQPAEQQPAPDVAGLVEALESLIKGYVGLLEAGMDRITSLGGDCDPVPVMEQNDPWLRDARAALAAHRKQGSEA